MTSTATLPPLPALLRELQRLATAGREWRALHATVPEAGAFSIGNPTVELLLDAGRDRNVFKVLVMVRALLARRIAAIPGFGDELAGAISLFRDSERFADNTEAAAVTASTAVDRNQQLAAAHRARCRSREDVDPVLFGWVGDVVAALDEFAGVPVCGRWQLAFLVLALADCAAAWAEWQAAVVRAGLH
jgi:hypothetical protein